MFPLLLAASASFSTPARSIPPDKVAEKFDSIIVFVPVISPTDSSPRPIDFKLEGQKRSVYFAAFSSGAINQLLNERLIPQNFKDPKSLKFVPFSLSKFDSLVQPKLSPGSNSRVVYIPDPVQVPYAEKLLIDQGTPRARAKSIAKDIPVIFCPSPSINATPNTGPLKGQTFVPCSTDYKTVKDITDKGVSDSSNLRGKKIGVVAIPVTSFASMLVKHSKQEIGDFRILPNPANIKLIKSVRQ